MATGYEVGMYRDIGVIAQEMRALVDIGTSLAQEVGRLADAQERANELADLVQEVGETPDS